MAVSCSADRQALGKITRDGVFLEELERDPARFLPDVTGDLDGQDDALDRAAVVRIDLTRPMDEIRAELSKHPVRTRVMLTGPMVVARDIAHAKIKERLDAGGRCRSTCRTTACTTPVRPRRPRATRPDRSGRPPPVGWTATSTSSRPPAAAS